MRILQLIDSLDAGGAERMAVNYANALAGVISFSGLVTTRKEGDLKGQLKAQVSYLFLNKKRSFDLKALFVLKSYVVENQVSVVHAHSSSFFLAFLLKLVHPSVRVLWHDHYGESEFLNLRPTFILRLSLPFFEGVISVNQKLKQWVEQKMHFKNTIYLANFATKENGIKRNTVLKGEVGKRIVCLANLRSQKNHLLLLEVAKILRVLHPEWTFHLVGKDFEDAYSAEIKKLIVEYGLKDRVFIYGSKNDVENIVQQAAICVLTSKSEGLPVALLEYGRGKKAVVVTAVGEIPEVVQNGENGFVVPQNAELFCAALVKLIENEPLRDDFGAALYQAILNSYSEEKIIKQYLKWLQQHSK
ncbi:glycosyltransferase family 4 protein [Flavobacterium sp. XN-5]|uniref:glycosyltransferase n=1 Tax=Flavobacterium sp. XN-5 TaxID=2599390 RepID=UPI0011C82671|nr:glycosyltransferase [Flavobacterium sp. XN-5]NGY37467.1 glycosyltransferase family 4 protein [Flavobacterium sp. XN-5]